MCGVGNKVCGICGNAGGCLAALREDMFFLASKEAVKKRLEKNEYPRDAEIMRKYLETPDETISFVKSLRCCEED